MKLIKLTDVVQRIKSVHIDAYATRLWTGGKNSIISKDYFVM